jgi:hypothetical protein
MIVRSLSPKDDASGVGTVWAAVERGGSVEVSRERRDNGRASGNDFHALAGNGEWWEDDAPSSGGDERASVANRQSSRLEDRAWVNIHHASYEDDQA